MLPDDIAPVSVNDHWVEPPDTWTARLPAARRTDAPRVVADDDQDRWIIGTASIGLAGLNLISAATDEHHRIHAHRTGDIHAAATEPHARLHAMDVDGVDVHTLLPTVAGFAGERLLALSDTVLRHQCVQAYNDALLDVFCAERPDRLAGIALVPFDDTDAAVAEIRRVAELGARGVSLPHNPKAFDLPGYWDHRWRPLFAEAAGYDLPIFVHVATGARDTPGADASPTEFLAFVCQVNLDVIDTAFALGAALTADAHALDGVRFVLLEGGTGWMPYTFDRLDSFWARRPELDEFRGATPLPSERRRQIFASFIDDSVGLRNRDQIGVNQMLWQSDFPHSDTSWPCSRELLKDLMRDVPDDEACAIAEMNARKLLRLP